MRNFLLSSGIALSLIFALMFSLAISCKGKTETEQEQKQLVYWSLWNKPEPQAQALNAIAADFAKQEQGAKLKIIYNGRQALVKLRSYLAANNPVDLFDGDGDQYLGLVTKEDLSVDLADLASGKSYDSAHSVAAALLPGVADVLAVNGVQYGLPYILNIIAFFYSKQAFADAGISAPPKTFGELLDASAKLQTQGVVPIALEGNVGFYQLWYFTSMMQKFAGENALQDIIRDKTGQGWDKPEVRLALETEQQLIDSGAIPPESAGYQYPAAQNNIAIGKTAMELVGSWLPTELAQTTDSDFRWGAFPFPSVSGGKNENKIALAPMAIGIYKDSKNIAESMRFIQYLLSASSQGQIAKLANVGVANKSISWPQDLADAKAMLQGADGAYLSDGGLSAFLPDFTTNSLQPGHSKFILGEISADEFIQAMKSATINYWQ